MPSRFASSVDMGSRQHGPCQPARFCKKSLLLLLASSSAYCCCCAIQVLLLHEGTNTCRRVPERITRQRQRCLKRARSKKSGLRHYRGKLGQSKASGESLANRMQRSNLIRPIHGSTIICFPNMTNLPIFNYICLGFVISCR